MKKFSKSYSKGALQRSSGVWTGAALMLKLLSRAKDTDNTSGVVDNYNALEIMLAKYKLHTIV